MEGNEDVVLTVLLTSTMRRATRNSVPSTMEEEEKERKEKRQGLLASLGITGWTKSAEFFGLPETEQLLDTYNCAYKGKILLQGHMYVFQKHVCFYSNVFTHVTKMAMPFESIVGIQKAKNFGLPNSIEIRVAEKMSFFTSYLSRDDAYKLLLKQWRENCKYAKLFRGTDSPSSGVGSPKVENKNTISSPSPRQSIQRLKSAPLEHAGMSEVDKSPVAMSWEKIGWSREGCSAAEVPAELELLGSADLPCQSAEVFFYIFLGGNGQYERYHELNECKDIVRGEWSDGDHDRSGKVRQVTFMAPTRSKIGPKYAACHQDQVCHVYKNDHIVYCIEQEMKNIPYGNYFKVLTRWDLFNTGTAPYYRCVVEVRVHVVFSKKTVWQSNIISGVHVESQRFFSVWEKLVREGLSPQEVIQAADEEEAAAAISIQNVPEQYQADFERLLKLRKESPWNFDYHAQLMNASLWALKPVQRISLLVRLKKFCLALAGFSGGDRSGSTNRQHKARKTYAYSMASLNLLVFCVLGMCFYNILTDGSTGPMPMSYMEVKRQNLEKELQKLDARQQEIRAILEQLQ